MKNLITLVLISALELTACASNEKFTSNDAVQLIGWAPVIIPATIITAPYWIPAIIYDTTVEDNLKKNIKSVEIGTSYEEVIIKVGRPESEEINDDGSKILIYKFPYSQESKEVFGIRNGYVVWRNL